jgi:hypothetical protein
MSDQPRRFLDMAMNGEVLADEIDDFVSKWHASDGGEELHEFLGMTWQEYSLWVTSPEYLSLILAARHRHQPLIDAVNDNYLSSRYGDALGEPDARRLRLAEWASTQR